MSADEAREILSGGDAVANEYLANKTTEQLTAEFHPIESSSYIYGSHNLFT